MTKKYSAYVQNETGATDTVPMQTHNKKELKSFIRARYGAGWRVHILAADIDADGQADAPYEIETFKLRG